jgi:hypothetical protein
MSEVLWERAADAVTLAQATLQRYALGSSANVADMGMLLLGVDMTYRVDV